MKGDVYFKTDYPTYVCVIIHIVEYTHLGVKAAKNELLHRITYIQYTSCSITYRQVPTLAVKHFVT